MYRAKEAGRNNYQLCTDEMKTPRHGAAVARDAPAPGGAASDQFVLHYQPQISLVTGRIGRRRGAGALERSGARADRAARRSSRSPRRAG